MPQTRPAARRKHHTAESADGTSDQYCKAPVLPAGPDWTHLDGPRAIPGARAILRNSGSAFLGNPKQKASRTGTADDDPDETVAQFQETPGKYSAPKPAGPHKRYRPKPCSHWQFHWRCRSSRSPVEIPPRAIRKSAAMQALHGQQKKHAPRRTPQHSSVVNRGGPALTVPWVDNPRFAGTPLASVSDPTKASLENVGCQCRRRQ